MLPTRPPLFAIVLVSASALAYEVLLLRLFSIIQWHNFAYMVISLALLGYAASGTFLSLTQQRWRKDFPRIFTANIVLFSLSAVVCFLLAQQIPFNPEQVLWDTTQPLYLTLIYLLLTVPFFFAANCIALSLACFGRDIARVYAMDLLGAGLGSLAVIGLLFIAFPNTVLVLISVLALLAAIVGQWEMRQARFVSVIPVALLAGVLLTLPDNWTSLNMSPYKSLSQALHVSGTRISEQRSSPLGLLSIVESPNVPWRFAPGLSFHATTEPPKQLGVFTDGDAMTAITHYNNNPLTLSYLAQQTSALPYSLSTPRHVLVPGAGGGAGLLQAHYFGAEKIEGIEFNPQLVKMLTRDYADFTGRFFTREDVSLHVSEARGFIRSSGKKYDLIQLAFLDSFGASSAGLYSLNENYLYTQESVRDFVRHLKPNGYLAISLWVKVPPRDMPRLFTTAVDALEQLGTDAEQQLILIRSWQTSTLLIKNGNITGLEIKNARRFCKQNGFDLAYFPGITQDDANHFNILNEPYFFNAATAILGNEREAYLRNYKFDIQPTTDDRPYFFHTLKWSSLREIFQLRYKGGIGLMEWGYVTLLATLLQAVIASVVFILLPLWFFNRRQADRHPASSNARYKLKVFGYFFSIGLAFLFTEIAFIQKFILFLHHPLYAAAVALASFLLFAGLGSAYSRRFVDQPDTCRATIRIIRRVVLLIGLVTMIYLLMLGSVFEALIALPVWQKALLAVSLIAPLAFLMGIPFPLALCQVSAQDNALVPWAWAINGCASVISAVLATLFAIHFGISVVILLAFGLYLLASLLFPESSKRARIAPS